MTSIVYDLPAGHENPPLLAYAGFSRRGGILAPGGNTTPANYAILDNNFLTGSKYGPAYTIYTGQPVTNNPSGAPLFLK